MLTRPTWHEAKAEARESEAEARESEAETRESEAEAREIFRGRGQRE